MDILFKEESYKIVGICMKIHRELGCGFKEIIYKDAIEVELRKHSIPFEREKRISFSYDNIGVTRRFTVDFLLFGCIVLEVKSSFKIFYQNISQTHNYLKVSGCPLGMVVNFGANSFEFKRILLGSNLTDPSK